jgi:crotonobetainyl-CoA:carnitine CoA-transferase CaiB-like acyl-CoA transferase
MVTSPASGLRVLEAGCAEGSARVCSRLLAQLGADVVRLAPAATSVVESADIVLIDHRFPGSYPLNAVNDGRRLAGDGAVVCVFSPFGLEGPLSDLWGTEIVVQAMAGMMSANGEAGDPPVMSGIPVARLTTGIQGLAAVLAAIIRRDRDPMSRVGELIDLSQYDVLVAMMGTLLPPLFLRGELPPRIGNRHMMAAPWNVYPSLDGWVVLTTMGEPMWHRFLDMASMTELLDDERFLDTELRVTHANELDEIVASWTKSLTTEALIQRATKHDLPASAIYSVEDAFKNALDRKSVAINSNQNGYSPGLPVNLVPNADILAPDTVAARRPFQEPLDDSPLSGIRVLEVGALTAGPAAGRILAMLGADVLKVEPPNGELSRHLAQRVSGDGYLYFLNNTGKRGTVLDLRDSGDVAELLRQSDHADVFLTNLGAESLAKAGVSWRELVPRNPELIYCAVSGYGAFGERANDKAFDTIIQAISGIMKLTGQPDGAPLKVAVSVVDYMSACAAAAGMVAALRLRQSGSLGCVVDVSMLEVSIWATQFAWDNVQSNRGTRRLGNGHSSRALHGMFQAADGPFVIDVVDDEGWRHVAEEIGIVGHEIDTLIGRSVHESEVVKAMQSWASSKSLDVVVAWLRQSGIPAGPVLGLDDVIAHEHVLARRLLIDQVTDGGDAIRVIGSPFKFQRARVEVAGVAPSLSKRDVE